MIKKLIYILILFLTCANFTLAQPQNAGIEYNSLEYSFKKFNIKKVLKTADTNMLLFQKAKTESDKKKYLDAAMKNYYIATKVNSKLIDGYIGLARVYDAMKLDRLAKEFFFKSVNIDTYNPRVNFYFGDFYFKRDEYLSALFHYKISYQNGYSKNYELNYRLGIIYEKLADIETAKKFYMNALKLKPKNKDLYEKIRLLNDINYEDSQYYLYRKTNKYVP